MALSSNPTKTRRIEQAFRRENKARFTKFGKGAITALRATQRINNFKQTRKQRITNVDPFVMTDDQFERYMVFLRVRAYQDIIGVNLISDANSAVVPLQTDQWQQKYITVSYARGLDSAQAQIRSGGLATGLSMAELRDLFTVGTEERAAQMMVETQALHGTTVASLQRTTLTSLIQATENMLAQMRRDVEVARSLVDPRITALVQDLAGRVSAANSTGMQIASTETIQAFQNGQINNAAIVSEQTGEEIQLRWLTRRDSKVRHLHARWHGVIMTQIEASQNINESPWNCRCGFANVPPRADTDKRQEMFDKERTRLIELESGS